MASLITVTHYMSVGDILASLYHLSVDDDLLIHGCILVIPSQMRANILSQLCEAHQGSVRSKQKGTPYSVLARNVCTAYSLCMY